MGPKIEKIINEALDKSYTGAYPIERFTIDELKQLSEEARKKVEIRIKAEHSNFYQGTLLEVKRLEDRVEHKINERLIKEKEDLQALNREYIEFIEECREYFVMEYGECCWLKKIDTLLEKAKGVE